MQLVDVTEKNWEKVISLTTDKKRAHPLIEEFVASNAYSIVQSVYEEGWTVKGIEEEEKLIGFTMYGYCKERDFYELCRFMIDERYQGNGYGKKALKIIINEIKNRFHCEKLYLSTEPDNYKAKQLYGSFGFAYTGELWDDEELYVLSLD